MASASISDFKITVKLDSTKAMAGLRSLHAKLNAFANSTRSSLEVEDRSVRKTKEKVSLLRRLITLARKLVPPFAKVALLLGRGIMKPFSMIGNMLGNWKWMILAAAGAATFLTSKIIKTGMAMQRASIAMQAAVGASDVAMGLSTSERAKLQKDQLNFAQKLAKTYGLGLTDTVNEYAKFFAASSKYIGVTGSENLFKSFAKLSVVYGLTAEKQKRAMTAFTQMASKNQVMAEELKQQLGDVLPGSMEIFARAMTKMGKWGTVTVENLYDMMAKGKIVASEVLPFVAEEMERMAAPTLANALKSTAVQFSRLQTQAEAAGAGIFNQFDKPLGELLKKIATFLEGRGMQVTIGQTIKDIIQDITTFLQPFFDQMDEFEKKWQKATREGKIKLLDEGTFYKSVLKGLKDAVTEAWNSLNLDPLKNKLIDLMSDVVIGVGSAVTDKLFGTTPVDYTKTDYLTDVAASGRAVRDAEGNIIQNVTNNVTVDVTGGLPEGFMEMQHFGKDLASDIASEINSKIPNPTAR